MPRRLEEMRGRNAAVRGRGARIVCDEPVDVEVVGDVERTVSVAPRVVSKRTPYGRRGLARPVARLVDERRRNVGEALERQGRSGLGDVLLGTAPEEHAVAPSIRRPDSDAGMDVVSDCTVYLVDCAGKRPLRKLSRGDRATQIARRQARAAHERGEGDRRDDKKRKDAKNDKKR